MKMRVVECCDNCEHGSEDIKGHKCMKQKIKIQFHGNIIVDWKKVQGYWVCDEYKRWKYLEEPE